MAAFSSTFKILRKRDQAVPGCDPADQRKPGRAAGQRMRRPIYTQAGTAGCAGSRRLDPGHRAERPGGRKHEPPGRGIDAARA